jgi:hypothetical protein
MSEETLADMLADFPGTRDEMIEMLADLTMELLMPRRPPDGPHTHKCGFDLDNPDAIGCGHEWEHDSSGINSSTEYDAAHACPKCGRDGWSWQFLDTTRREFERRHGVPFKDA